MRFIKLFSCLALFAGLAACNDNDSSSEVDKQESKFDREAMLTNLGQNVIMSNYADFAAKARDLQEATRSFTEEPGTETLEKAQKAFKGAYKAWQHVTPYNFGPAQRMALRDNMNTFPTSASGIEQRIQEESYSWGPYDNDTKGFPALDYLLFKGASASEIVSAYKRDQGPKRARYLEAVVDDIVKQSEDVLRQWKPSGNNYVKTFANATANDKGSSLSHIVNQLNYDFEIIKDEKLGIPAGKKSRGNTFPGKVEGYHSELSLTLMKENLNAIEELFLGKYDGNDGLGLDDHLDELNAERQGTPLSDKIVEQFGQVRSTLDGIPQPLAEQVEEGHPKIDQSFNAIKKQIVFIKTEMPSELGVRITYQDNDGD
jgi:predicted lipoprotein